jgi:hypothetical protein
MEKEFTTYEQALALKELGFDDYAFNWYSTNRHPSLIAGIFLTINPNEPLYSSEMHKIGIWKIKAPLKQQVFRWFREQMFLIDFSSHDVDTYEFYIRWKSNKSMLSDIYNTYEEAENACIDKLIEIAKQQDNGTSN